MPCSLEIFPDVPVGTVYFGLNDGSVYFDYVNLESWDNTTLTGFLAQFTTEVAAWRTTGYQFSHAIDGFIGQLWIIVPATYPTPVITAGFQFALSLSVTPTGTVYPPPALVTAEAAYTQVNIISNTCVQGWKDPVFGTQSTNGWTYFQRFIGGILYNFFPFSPYLTTACPFSIISFSRTTGVATITPDNAVSSPPYGKAFVSVTVPENSSFNITDMDYALLGFPGIPTSDSFTYANAGVNVGSSPSIGSVTEKWIGSVFFGGPTIGCADNAIGDVTIFVTT